jgi:hypothetical protein
LKALRHALLRDDRRLIQGAVCSPPALQALSNLRVEATCAIGYCGWQEDGLATVGAVEDFFQRVCDGADAAMKEAAACRYFLNWFDDTPRDEMRRQLLAEVHETLRRRQASAA